MRVIRRPCNSDELLLLEGILQPGCLFFTKRYMEKDPYFQRVRSDLETAKAEVIEFDVREWTSASVANLTGYLFGDREGNYFYLDDFAYIDVISANPPSCSDAHEDDSSKADGWPARMTITRSPLAGFVFDIEFDMSTSCNESFKGHFECIGGVHSLLVEADQSNVMDMLVVEAMAILEQPLPKTT